MEQPVLTISVLVSGREETTKQCLDSLQGLLDKLNCELILVDTGCKEPLRGKLREYTDQVIPFEWCDDFAKARNAGLERARGEWFLFLDDDEWFEDVTPIVEFFQSGEYLDYEQAVYLARNYSRKDGSAYTDDWVSRMIRLREDTHFEGRVHESLVPTRGKCKRLSAYVHHYGYAFGSEVERRAHYERNVTILERLMHEEPDNIRWWLQIVPEYIGIGDGEALVRISREALGKLAHSDRPFLNQCRGTFYSAVLVGLSMQKRYGEVMDCWRGFRGDGRNTPAANCSLDLLATRAVDHLYEQKAGDARPSLKDMLELGADYFAQLALEDAATRSEQEEIIAESIVLVKDAVEEDARREMGFLYAKALARWNGGLETGKEPVEIPRELRAGLGECVQAQLAGNGEFLMLPELYWELGEAGVLPLEELLLSLPMDQWAVQLAVLESRGDAALWERLSANLARIRTREDGRYQIFDSYAAKAQLQAMAGEAKKQVCALMDAGLWTEAGEVVRQLRQMLPEDGELMELAERIRREA